MQIPMGTVVTATMLIGTLFAYQAPSGGLNKFVPKVLTKAVGFVLGAAGLWNVLWYGLQNLTQFWGHMALGSGVGDGGGEHLAPSATRTHTAIYYPAASYPAAPASRLWRLLRMDDLQLVNRHPASRRLSACAWQPQKTQHTPSTGYADSVIPQIQRHRWQIPSPRFYEFPNH